MVAHVSAESPLFSKIPHSRARAVFVKTGAESRALFGSPTVPRLPSTVEYDLEPIMLSLAHEDLHHWTREVCVCEGRMRVQRCFTTLFGRVLTSNQVEMREVSIEECRNACAGEWNGHSIPRSVGSTRMVEHADKDPCYWNPFIQPVFAYHKQLVVDQRLEPVEHKTRTYLTLRSNGTICDAEQSECRMSSSEYVVSRGAVDTRKDFCTYVVSKVETCHLRAGYLRDAHHLIVSCPNSSVDITFDSPQTYAHKCDLGSGNLLRGTSGLHVMMDNAAYAKLGELWIRSSGNRTARLNTIRLEDKVPGANSEIASVMFALNKNAARVHQHFADVERSIDRVVEAMTVAVGKSDARVKKDAPLVTEPGYETYMLAGAVDSALDF